MHDKLLTHQDALSAKDLIRYGGEIGLDAERFMKDLRKHAGEGRVAEDQDSADLSSVLHQRQAALRRLRHRDAL
jgi:hypothetical protein